MNSKTEILYPIIKEYLQEYFQSKLGRRIRILIFSLRACRRSKILFHWPVKRNTSANVCVQAVAQANAKLPKLETATGGHKVLPVELWKIIINSTKAIDRHLIFGTLDCTAKIPVGVNCCYRAHRRKLYVLHLVFSTDPGTPCFP